MGSGCILEIVYMFKHAGQNVHRRGTSRKGVMANKTALFALSAVILSGCGGSGGGGSDTTVTAKTGSVSFALVDAPIDSAQHVYVEFTGLELKAAGGKSETVTFDKPKRIDLLAQQGGNSALLLSNEELPSGEYNWVRLAVNAEDDSVMDSYIVLSDSSEHELDVPSGSQSGLKLNRGFTVPEGGSANFTIDFDLRHSIVLTGNGKYKLKPVLRLVDNTGASTIKGVVDSTLISNKCDDANLFAGAVYIYEGLDVTPDDIDEVSPNPFATASVKYNADSADYEYSAVF